MHPLNLPEVIALFAVVLGIMVFIHELGHFLVAKACGVRIEAFSLGFGPRLFGIRHNGTDYKICALPLGGYVKMAGEYGEHALNPAAPTGNAPRSGDFTAQPRSNRILIALAGPFANFILSFFLLTVVSLYHHEVNQYLNGPAVVDYVPANTPAARTGIAAGDTILSFNGLDHPNWLRTLEECAENVNRTLPITFLHNGQTVSANLDVTTGDNGDFSIESMEAIGIMPREQLTPLGVASISGGTPAARAGLQPGDLITRIDDFEPHSVYTLHAYLNDRHGAPAAVYILRSGQPLTLNLSPERVDSDPKHPQYQIGFLPRAAPVDVDRLPLGQAMAQSFKDNRHDSMTILRVLKGLFTRHVSVKQMSGPVGIAQDIAIAFQMGIWPLLRLMSMISINLGIFNLLPIPILDGGMILFLVIESFLRRDVNLEVKERVYQVAFVCIIAFAFFVLFNDITKLHLGGH